MIMNDIKFNNRIITLDILKFILTIIILLHHYQQSTGFLFKHFINFYGGKFYFGYVVEIFFIISGFLIMHKFIDKFNNNIDNPFNFLGGGVKKYFLYMFLTNLCCGIILIFNYNLLRPSYNFWSLTKSLIGIIPFNINDNQFLGTNNPTWYITILIFLSIIFSILVKFIKNNEELLFAFAIIILFAIQLRAMDIYGPFLNGAVYRGITCYFLGSLCCILVYKYGFITVFFSIFYLLLAIIHQLLGLNNYNRYYIYIYIVLLFTD